MTRINLGALKVDAITQEEAITLIKNQLLKSSKPNILVTPNAGHLVNISANTELSNIYSTADLSLIDGWPIAIAAGKASKTKVNRVTGSDLLPELFTQLNKDIRIVLASELKNYDWAGSRPDWIMCVGATIDFLTGQQNRAPKIFQKVGLEWFYRLITNPSKFSERYLKAIIPSIKLIANSFRMRKFN